MVLAIISDLHFTEEGSSAVSGVSSGASRNLHPEAFRLFFAWLTTMARRNVASRIDLVFAGDVFDLHRTAMWFGGDLRPWETDPAHQEALGRRALEILNTIAGEEWVDQALDAIRRFAGGEYIALNGDERAVGLPVHVHFVPGNHDRLVACFPACRRRVRELLGMGPSDEPFPTHLLFAEERTLVRHGHEYDRYNFSRDLGRRRGPIPAQLSRDSYLAPAFGDLVTVDVAARLPGLFRRHYGDRIARSTLLRALDGRLRAFDDVRPQSALARFLLEGAGDGVTPGRAWRALEPVVLQLLEELAVNDTLNRWLRRLDARWRPDLIDLVQAALGLRVWRGGIPYGVVRKLLSRASKETAEERAAFLAAREKVVRENRVRLVVAGHTHHPGVHALPGSRDSAPLYIDTGTWRRRILGTADGTGFAELKSLAAVTVYGPDEDPGQTPRSGKEISFDFWDGLTRHFFVDGA